MGKKHSNAIQARKGMTQEELKSKGLIKACPTDIPGKGLLSNKDGILCNMQNWEVIDKNKPQKYVPAKDWYEKATENELLSVCTKKGCKFTYNFHKLGT
jgi:hypothetical protein